MTSAGAVNVSRTLYRTQRNGPTYCPMEEQAGVISALWTPRAARQAIQLTARLNPYDVETVLSELGGMQPSRSSIERLPKALNQHWETKRENYEHQLRQAEQIPKDTVTVSVSLDGVLIPIKGAGGMGYSPYQEASCGTLSYYDEGGQMLHTTYLSRMPEHKKKTLKEQLKRELKHALQQQPNLTVVKLADGAKDNWHFLEDALPKGYNVLDFFHAAEHLKQATDAIHGEKSLESSKAFKKWREILLNDDTGIEKLRRFLKRQHKKYPRRKVIAEQITYFNNNKHRCYYARLQNLNFPIGSGVVESACKTIVQQRLKCAGMQWQHKGGQAILNFRTLIKSNRFDSAWNIISNVYIKRWQPCNDDLYQKVA